MPHFPNFKTLPKIWLLMKWLFPSREGWFSNSTYQKNASISASKFSNFVTRLDTCMAQHVTATHVTLTELTRKIEGHSHKLYMDNFFSSPELFDDLVKKTDLLLWHCQAEQERHATRPKTEDNKTEKGRHSRENQGWLEGKLWRDKRDVCMLTNIHNAPAEGNFCNEGGKAISRKLWRIITITWGMWIRVTEWPTVNPSAAAHSSGRKNCSFTC